MRALPHQNFTMLAIALPHHSSLAAQGYDHVYSDGFKVLRSGQAMAGMLSQHSGEVIGLIPASRLSWIALDLPPVGKASRLNQVVHSLLEELVLEDLDKLHVVLPNAVATQGGSTVVAVCDKHWLREALAPLQTAGIRVQRLVAEISPTPNPVLHVIGTPQASLCALSHPQGVTVLPPNTAQWPALGVHLDPSWTLYAEPAMAEQVHQLLQREAELQTAAQRWIAASPSAWDLAQGEWAQGGAQRMWRDAQKLAQNIFYAPVWQPVRWGVLSLLVVQILGLNALAWRENKLTHAHQQQLKQVFTSTFPQVNPVIDAALQMRRETAQLQQSVGQLANIDLEFMLNALGHALPQGVNASQIDYSAGLLKIKGLRLSDAQRLDAQKALHASHLRLTQDNDGAWLIQIGDAS
jgi:general secretion pathway protein L